MNQLLTIGQTVHSRTSRMALVVDQFLGGGGQGEVYRVALQGQSLAVKWFYPHYLREDPRLRERLERAVQLGAPSDRFLWPLELVNAPGVAGFGYLMALREPNFKGLADLVTRRVEPSFQTLATIGFELAHSYLQLHAKGLCYRDISFGNVFFDPATGEVRICDNDNVDVDGQPGAIGGTARFMAPEIVRGESTPSTQTDLFSLAVLLFYLLMNHHPLEGAREAAIHCFDLPAMTKLYGIEPLFIYDPDDERNRPVPGYHDNALVFWPIYPEFMRKLFVRAFTTGLRDPAHGRVRESEWRAALVQLRDVLCYCPACKAENFYDADTLRATGQPSGGCWACGQPVRLPPRLRLTHGSSRQVVVLRHDTKLYPHHLDRNRQYDFSAPTAEIAFHPTNPNIWGLKNLGADKWVATTAGGEVRDVPPGRTVTIATGTRIQFGASEGILRL
jgi:DNA-binding helix-hairpin-helix protein with protein kinase domain